jgi:hypothetical protein
MVSCGSRTEVGGSTPLATLSSGLPSAGFAIKSGGEVLAVLPGERVQIRIDPGNQGAQAIWDAAVVVIRPADRIVFTWRTFGTLPAGASATKLSDLKPGERISFVLHPGSKSADDESYEVSLIGRGPIG